MYNHTPENGQESETHRLRCEICIEHLTCTQGWLCIFGKLALEIHRIGSSFLEKAEWSAGPIGGANSRLGKCFNGN